MSLAFSPMFEGLGSSALNDVLRRMRPQYYAEDEYICRQGELGEGMYLLERGLVDVIVESDTVPTVIDRLRPGDIAGEMTLITDEPRATTLRAVLPTLVLKLDRPSFAKIISQYPAILMNITRMLVKRHRRSTSRLIDRGSTAQVAALVIGPGCEDLARSIISATRMASRRTVSVVDLSESLTIDKVQISQESLSATLAVVDAMIDQPRFVVVVAQCGNPNLHTLMRYANRVFILGNERDVHESVRYLSPERRADIFLTDTDFTGSDAIDTSGSMQNIRIARILGDRKAANDIAWCGRHMAGTKIGLALGAGGAKGFAHLGVYDALKKAGYAVDYISGSSIGALVGSLLNRGNGVSEAEAQLKAIWAQPHVEQLSLFSPAGRSVGLERVLGTVKEIVGDASMINLSRPLRILSADLEEGLPVPIDDWPLFEALSAGMSIPGLAPPYEHHGRRLVDAVCLTPVPSRWTRDMGADIVVSVNLLNRKTKSKSGKSKSQDGIREAQAQGRLDPVVETLMMLQTDASIRDAAEADIVMTPRFSASTWRDFHLADLFREAGREAAEAELHSIADIAPPLDPKLPAAAA